MREGRPYRPHKEDASLVAQTCFSRSAAFLTDRAKNRGAEERRSALPPRRHAEIDGGAIVPSKHHCPEWRERIRQAIR